MTFTDRLKLRLKASGLHLLISMVVVAGTALLIFAVWYPGPFRDLAGGSKLFWLIVGVDLVLGPLLTLAVFDRRKSTRELSLDLGLVGAIQLGALAYGIFIMAAARPVVMAFEVDLFRLVAANEVASEQLALAPDGLRSVSWSGPEMVGIAPPRVANEVFESVQRAMQGMHLAAQPKYWVRYAEVKSEVARRAKPISELTRRRPAQQEVLASALLSADLQADSARWLPLVSRRSTWIVLLDPSGTVRGYASIDPF